MDADTVLSLLLYLTLLFSILLLLVETAMVGRKLADLEYQTHSGSNGIRRSQASMNLRIHTNRVVVGAVFIIVSALLIGNAPIEWRTWTNRIMFALMTLLFLISSIWDWSAERAQMVIYQRRSRIAQDAEAFGAGVHDAEEKAEVKADALANLAAEGKVATLATQVEVMQAAADTTPVDVATIQPEAAQAIANAVTPAAARTALEAIADALPTKETA